MKFDSEIIKENIKNGLQRESVASVVDPVDSFHYGDSSKDDYADYNSYYATFDSGVFGGGGVSTPTFNTVKALIDHIAKNTGKGKQNKKVEINVTNKKGGDAFTLVVVKDADKKNPTVKVKNQDIRTVKSQDVDALKKVLLKNVQ